MVLPVAMHLLSVSLERTAFLPLICFSNGKKTETLLQDLLTHSQIAGELGHSWDKQIPVCSALTCLTCLFLSWLLGSHPSGRCLSPRCPVPVRSSASSHTPSHEDLVSDIPAVVPGHPVYLYAFWVHCFAAASTSN